VNLCNSWLNLAQVKTSTKFQRNFKTLSQVILDQLGQNRALNTGTLVKLYLDTL
jgi:hypothetical protein